MKILGIDPGYGIVGWAVVDDSMCVAACGCIETDSSLNFDERLLQIHLALKKIIEEQKPDVAAVERLFFSRNTTTALDVAKAVGVMVLTLRMYNISYFEYTPIQVKRALTGYGRATKGQIQSMIARIFGIKTSALKDDLTDAISVAACHCLLGSHYGRAKTGGAI